MGYCTVAPGAISNYEMHRIKDIYFLLYLEHLQKNFRIIYPNTRQVKSNYKKNNYFQELVQLCNYKAQLFANLYFLPYDTTAHNSMQYNFKCMA